jgi:RimJ/RimL family protein N-acetyltransferase
MEVNEGLLAFFAEEEGAVGEVFPENLASARVLEKNRFLLEETKPGAVVKGGKAMDVRVYRLASDQSSLHDF